MNSLNSTNIKHVTKVHHKRQYTPHNLNNNNFLSDGGGGLDKN